MKIKKIKKNKMNLHKIIYKIKIVWKIIQIIKFVFIIYYKAIAIYKGIIGKYFEKY